MSSAIKLAAEVRTAEGSLQCRKLRRKGLVPGNLYGHKQEAVRLQAPAVDFTAMVKAGSRLIDVQYGGKSEMALLREVQWDSLGDYIQHFDLQRVDPNERLTIEVHVELKGTAKGTLSGGLLDHTLRSLTVECPVTGIPDHIQVKIGELEIGQAVHVRDIQPPENVKILNSPEAIVVRVAAPQAVPEPTAPGTEAGPTQPEVIGRKAEETEEAEE